MASTSTKILTAEQEAKLRQPIDEYVGKIQDQINDLREDGTDKVIEIQSAIDSLKRDKSIPLRRRKPASGNFSRNWRRLKRREPEQGRDRQADQRRRKLLKGTLQYDYYQAVIASCRDEKVLAEEKYRANGCQAESGASEHDFQAQRRARNQGRKVRS